MKKPNVDKTASKNNALQATLQQPDSDIPSIGGQFKTAAQYVRERLGIGLEDIDTRLEKVLVEIELGIADVQVLIKELSAAISAADTVRIQKELAKNPFFSECDSNFSFENDPHIARFEHWHSQHKQPTAFEKLKFKVSVLDAWWIVNTPSPSQKNVGITTPVVDVPSKSLSRKTEATVIFEAKVVELLSKFWADRIPGKVPTKSELCILVYQEMLRGSIRGKRKMTQGMVSDTAKRWKQPIVLPAHVPDSKYQGVRHPFKGDK